VTDDAATVETEVEGRLLRFSNVDRVLWPAAGYTKAQMLDYYRLVAPAILPHVRDRALTLGRFPTGVHERGWYQTNCRGHPEWLPVQELVGRRGQRMRLCVVNDVASLLWVVNQGTIELHPFLARRGTPDAPDFVVFDLDPGKPAGPLEAARLAVRLRDRLARDGLESHVKTSGSVGIHVFVGLAQSNGASFEETKAWARGIAAAFARERPDEVVDRSVRSLRARRVLIDWLQNDPTRSTVAAYSLRAMPLPTVSTPVEWDEVEEAVRHSDVARLVFGPGDVLRRLSERGDPLAPVLSGSGALTSAGATMPR
jgi:bifunctional non-homologous end joining protein LigD